ncbi:hypothetical protein THAOC_09609, partial [Thalassiosira oceanica]
GPPVVGTGVEPPGIAGPMAVERVTEEEEQGVVTDVVAAGPGPAPRCQHRPVGPLIDRVSGA